MLDTKGETFVESKSLLLSRKQPLIGFAIIIALVAYGLFLNGQDAKLAMHLLAGVTMGYVLSRARFGFAGGIKRIMVRGEGSLTKALLVTFAVTMFVMFGLQWLSAQGGAVPEFMAAEGEAIIPGTQNVEFANIATIIGGFLFGVGMIFSGGCASGTLTDMGEGEGRAWLTIVFFVLASVPGELARNVVDSTALGAIGVQTYLPTIFGFFGALLVSLAGLGLIYFITIKYENKRQLEGTYADPKGDWEDFEQPIAEDDLTVTPLMKAYHKLFVERWTFMKGGLFVAFTWLFILLTQNKAWGVTSPFSKMGVYVLNLFGMNFSNPKLAELQSEVAGGLMLDGGTIRNFGLIIGATVAFLLAGRFTLNFKLTLKDSAYFIVGGLLMGFGARFAKGCNAGALYSAISTFSVSGWIFLVSMALGGGFALKTFAGKACTLPKLK